MLTQEEKHQELFRNESHWTTIMHRTQMLLKQIIEINPRLD